MKLPDNVKESIYEMFHTARYFRGVEGYDYDDEPVSACMVISLDNDEVNIEQCNMDGLHQDSYMKFFSHVIGTGQGEYIVFIAESSLIANPSDDEKIQIKRAMVSDNISKMPNRSTKSLTATIISADGLKYMLSSPIESCMALSNAYSHPDEMHDDIETVMMFKKNPKYGWKEIEVNDKTKVGISLKGWKDFSKMVEKSAETFAKAAGVEGWN